MKKILLSLAVAFGMQAGAQTIDAVIADTVRIEHYDDGSKDTLSISKIDSITFEYINDTIWVSSSGCNGLTSFAYNGYTYDLVEIGGQCWFKEILQTTTYRDATPIDYPGTDTTAWLNNTTGAYAWYDDDSSTNTSTYGALYNWHAVDNPAGLCPTGWHVPSDSSWTVLESYLQANEYNYDGSTTGNKYAKAMADTVLWYANSVTGTVGNTDYPSYRNKSEFSGLPGGRRGSSGNYFNIGFHGYWWSSTQYSTINAWHRYLNFYSSNVWRNYNSKESGFSVRCLKD